MRLLLPKGKKQSKAHAHAPKQERKTAKRLGAFTVHRSGAGTVKGDVRKKRVVRIECKATSKQSFRVTLKMVRKIEEAALMSGEVPAIEVEFIDPRGVAIATVCVVPKYVLDLVANPS